MHQRKVAFSYIHKPVPNRYFLDLFFRDRDGLGRNGELASRDGTVTRDSLILHLTVTFTEHHTTKKLTEVIVRIVRNKNHNVRLNLLLATNFIGKSRCWSRLWCMVQRIRKNLEWQWKLELETKIGGRSEKCHIKTHLKIKQTSRDLVQSTACKQHLKKHE